jgi:tetratricopeptide (TPR) repeat protein
VLLAGALAASTAASAQTGFSGAAPPNGLDAPIERPQSGDRVLALERLQPIARLLAAGAAEPAFDALTQALLADPACVEALVRRAQLRLEEGPFHDPFQALLDARTAALIAPDDPAVIAAEGLSRYLLGDGERSRALLERYVALKPAADAPAASAAANGTLAAVAEALGFLALRRGEVDAAEKHFGESVKLRPNRAWSRYGIALVAGERGDLEAKLAELDEAVLLDGHLLVARHERALALARLGRRDEAAKERRIAELLRQLVDDTSERAELDHARRANCWLELARLLGDSRSWLRRWRELSALHDHATIATEGVALLADGRLAPEIVIETARAQARVGSADAARSTAARLAECRPPLPPELLMRVDQEIERLLKAARPSVSDTGARK